MNQRAITRKDRLYIGKLIEIYEINIVNKIFKAVINIDDKTLDK